MAVTGLAVVWNTVSAYYTQLPAMIAADPNKVPFGYSIGVMTTTNLTTTYRADVMLRVTNNLTGAVVGERLIAAQYFAENLNNENHLVTLTSPLLSGTTYTQTIMVTNGRPANETSGGLTAGPITRQFTTAGTMQCPPGYHLENGACVKDTSPPPPPPPPGGTPAGWAGLALLGAAVLAFSSKSVRRKLR